MTVIADAPMYPHGYVVGRYLTAVADSVSDSDRLMDFTPAKGRVIFTPERGHRTTEGPVPTFVVQRPVECPLDDQGYLTSPGGGRGVGLIVGVYLVRFEVQGAQVPGPTRIEVREDHTELAPLDLILAMPEVVPPGAVVIVDETTAQRAEAAAARAEAVVADLDAEVESVVLSHPDLRGPMGVGVSSITDEDEDGVATVAYTDGSTSALALPRGLDGDPGEDGHTPELTWQGTALAVDGVPGPDLKGAPGVDGKTPTIRVGSVTSGASPAASITGTSPDLTLGLVLPKGDPGAQGPPGVVSSASSYVIVGPGRPDQPSTTAGTITGSEPVGAEYRSTDGAGVGAWTWRKRPTGWVVTDGDTGWREMPGTGASGTVLMNRARRIGQTVQMIGRSKNETSSTITWPKVFNAAPASGFNMEHASPLLPPLPLYLGDVVTDAGWEGATRTWITSPKHFPANGIFQWRTTWTTADPWPTAPLPGSAA